MNPNDLMKGFNWNPTAEGFENSVVRLYKLTKTRLLKSRLYKSAKKIKSVVKFHLILKIVFLDT